MSWYRYWAEEFHVKHPGAAPAAEPRTTATRPDPQTPEEDSTRRLDPVAGDRGSSGSGSPTILVIANQKGGVGKTTTAVNLSRALADLGHPTLLVDIDPQANASSGLGLRATNGQPSIYDVLVRDTPVVDAIVPTGAPRLDLLPSAIALAGAEVELVSAFSRERRLAGALDGAIDGYRFVLVDCPPSLGLLTVNALTAGSAVLVPIQCEYYALEGLQSLLHNIELIRLHLNPGLATVGYVMTMHDGRTRLSEQVVAEVRRHFGPKVFDTRVPRSVRLAEAPSFGQSIVDYDPSSRGAVAYHRVAGELLDRLDAGTITS